MRKIILLICGVVAFFILIANLGPMVLLGISLWLLYIIFKRFIKSQSTINKVGWFILGIFVLCLGFSNLYALIGVAAAYVLYVVIKNWKKKTAESNIDLVEQTDPFTNFEREWSEINNKGSLT